MMFDDPGPKGERDPNWKLPKKGWSRWEKLTEWDVYVETAKKFSEMLGREVSTEEARALCKAHDRIMVHDFTQRAVKPRPSGRGYKAHLNWNFCLFVCAAIDLNL